MEIDDTVTMGVGLVGKLVCCGAGLQILSVEKVAWSSFARCFPYFELIHWVKNEVEPYDTVTAMKLGLVCVFINAGFTVFVTVESKAFALANVLGDGGLIVDGPIIEMEVDGFVTAILGLLMVLVCVGGADVGAVEVVGAVGTDGLIEVLLFNGMYLKGDINVDVGKAITDEASVSGCASCGSGNRVL